MLSLLSERQFHTIRWVLAIAWCLLISSLFWDPISPYLTTQSNHGIPGSSADQCVLVQGVCLLKKNYGLGTSIFWGIVISAGLLIIFVFGHEMWRRICPLAFFSQIPKALGFQRKQQTVSANGKVRYELVSIDKKSWLGQNYLRLQFAFLVLGLVIRLLFVNSDRLALAVFLMATILAAIVVGFLYAGKSWCQYFCPMAPVQLVFTGPRGLLGSQAHLAPDRAITQSTCREIDSKSNKEISACVGCQSPCIDIDAERAYWKTVTHRDRKLVIYGYFGLVLGFYGYFFLYAGNWQYYYSGIWTQEPNQLGTLLSPGFYLWNTAIPFPKLLAVPLTLILFTAVSYWGISMLEKLYRTYLQKQRLSVGNEQVLHRMFTVVTFLSWNLIWVFASRPNLAQLPVWIERLFTGFIILVSGFWFYRTFNRSFEQYSREGLAKVLRKQLNNYGFEASKYLGIANEELKSDEIFVLAKVLPSLSQTAKLEMYKSVIQAALRDGVITSAENVLIEELKTAFEISQDEHFAALASLGIEDPGTLSPKGSDNLERKMRIDGYQDSIKALLVDVIDHGVTTEQALMNQSRQIESLRRTYRITDDEHEEAVDAVFDASGGAIKKAQELLTKLEQLRVQTHCLDATLTAQNVAVYRLLRAVFLERQSSILHRLLSALQMMGNTSDAKEVAQLIAAQSDHLMSIVLDQSRVSGESWNQCLSSDILARLLTNQPSEVPITSNIALETLLVDLLQHDLEPLVRALSLYGFYQLLPDQGLRAAKEILEERPSPLLEEVAHHIVTNKFTEQAAANGSQNFTALDKLFCLAESQYFDQLPVATMMEIASLSRFQVYEKGEVICQAGEKADAMYILYLGQADVQVVLDDGAQQTIHQIPPGETIGELGVLTQEPRSATVTASAQPTIVLVLEAIHLESLIRQRSAMAIGLLEMIARRLQRTNQR